MKKTPFKSLSYVTMEGYLLVHDFEDCETTCKDVGRIKMYKLNDD